MSQGRWNIALLLVMMASPLGAQDTRLVTDLDSVRWGAPGGGNGFPLGVQTAPLGVDSVTGGITYYARFPAGSRFELHWHSHSEYVAVLRGGVSLNLDGEEHALAQGSYVVIPQRMAHAWTVPDTEDVIILVRRAGPADFNFIDE